MFDHTEQEMPDGETPLWRGDIAELSEIGFWKVGKPICDLYSSRSTAWIRLGVLDLELAQYLERDARPFRPATLFRNLKRQYTEGFGLK